MHVGLVDDLAVSFRALTKGDRDLDEGRTQAMSMRGGFSIRFRLS